MKKGYQLPAAVNRVAFGPGALLLMLAARLSGGLLAAIDPSEMRLGQS